MKLIDQTTFAEVSLPNGLLWQDEFDWTPVVSSKSYTLTGSLVIESGLKQAGRPFTLSASKPDEGWVTRATSQTLLDWAAIPDRVFKLVFEYPTDARQFTVRFDHSADSIKSTPVKGFPSHNAGDWFSVSLKLIGV